MEEQKEERGEMEEVRDSLSKDPNTAANDYLTSKLQEPQLQVAIKETASVTANAIEERVKDSIRSQPLRSSVNGNTLSLPQIKRTSLNSAELFEAKVRDMRAKQSEKEHFKGADNTSPINCNSERNLKEREHSWLSAEERKKWKEDWEEKEKNAKEFVKKMREAKASVERQKAEARKKDQEKLATELQRNQDVIQKLEERRLRQQEERKQQAEQKKRERLKFRDHAKAAAPHNEPLYTRMEREFAKKEKISGLQRQKLMLAKKRSIPKLIKFDEVEERTRLMEEFKRKKEEENKKRAAEMKLQQALYLQKVESNYKNAFTEEVIKEKEEAKARKEAKELNREKQVKRNEYARLAQEAYAPKFSEKKAQELQRLVSKLKHPTRKNRPPKAPTEPPQEKLSRSNSASSEHSEERPIKKAKRKVVRQIPVVKSLDSSGNSAEPKPLARHEVLKKKVH
eukprot:TRINITY_DN3840_c0_g5_i3.p1 TRINITY_DN3840_c0_g5~~TRINITY_DN3840_c0_g5_i3.p1  ORF type:complete len:454 (-),score=167.51 TRINITY_DN3840_c0_g5_i3:395-1756(-)